MSVVERSAYRVPFPEIPDRMKLKYSFENLALRPFGLCESDLCISFNQQFHPYLVTQILQCCTTDKNGNKPDEALFWDLTVGKRLECLLAVIMSGRTSELSFRLQCLNETCQQRMEIDVSREEIAELQCQSDRTDPVIIHINSERMLIRKPTGKEQLEWLKHSFSNEEAAIKMMIRTLLHNEESTPIDWEYPIPDEWIVLFDEAMQECDPLVNFDLTTCCPYCKMKSHYKIDLEERIFRELHDAQRNLLQTVHRLAANYHWSEQQILSIPPWRRSYYLALIDKEESQR